MTGKHERVESERGRGGLNRDLLAKLVIEDKLDDAAIAARFGLTAKTVQNRRTAWGIANVRGWPVSPDRLEELAERHSDDELAAMFGVHPRTIAHARLGRGLRRMPGPLGGPMCGVYRTIGFRGPFQGGVGRRRERRQKEHDDGLTLLERVLARLGPRVTVRPEGYRLDGRPVSVWDLYRAADCDIPARG